MSQSVETAEPQIVEFGPYRVIGMSYKGKNENAEIKAMWEEYMLRVDEIGVKLCESISFGLCRCIPNVKNGSFEYIAAVPVESDTPVPDGMVNANIAKCKYAVFPVSNLDKLIEEWNRAMAWFKAHPKWKTYCNPEVCDCGNYPSFELYPKEFCKDGKLFIYFPIKPKP